MPIYEDQVSYEDMKKLAKTHRCAVCGTGISIKWSAESNCYILGCHDLSHNTITRYRELSPEEIESRKSFQGGTIYMETKALKKLDSTQMLDRVNKARFPKELTIEDRQLIAQIAIEYGLDPLFGELMVYQGRPYVTIDARRRKAQETGNLDGMSARPATKEERAARQVGEKDYLFVAEVWVKEASHPFEGWGTVREAETKGDSHLPIVKDPASQCEKRAEAQALRRAFHLPLPSFEEVIEAEFTVVSDEKVATKSKTSPPKQSASPPAPGQKNLATEPQINKIWGDAEKMGYVEDEIHAIIMDKWEVESVKGLSIAQASDLIGMIARGEGISASKPEERELEGPLHANPDNGN